MRGPYEGIKNQANTPAVECMKIAIGMEPSAGVPMLKLSILL